MYSVNTAFDDLEPISGSNSDKRLVRVRTIVLFD